MNSNRFRRAIVAPLILDLGAVMACSRPVSEGRWSRCTPSPREGAARSGWVTLREAGLDAREVKVSDLAAVKREHGVRSELGSCHTAIEVGISISSDRVART